MTEATRSEIVLNNRSPNAKDVTPTFYTEEGHAITGKTIQLKPTEIRFVEIKKLIPVQHRGERSWGGMSLSYMGNVLEVWAQIALMDVGGTGSTDVTFSVLDGRGSDVQEAVWWMPERGTASIALGNSSATPLHTTVQFSDGESQDVDIAPFATKYIRRRADARSGANSSKGGTAESVKLRMIGPSGSLRVVGLVTSDNHKFTSSIRFYEPQAAVQPHLFATNLRLKNTSPRMVLRNTSDAEINAQPRFRPAAGESGGVVELPSQTLRPREVVEVDLSPLMSIAAGRTDLDSVSVQVTNTGAPGSLIGALNNFQTDGDTIYDVPLRDSGRTRNLTGSYPWRVDKDYTTVVTITNVGDQPASFHVDVRYPGGSYYLAPRELAIGETATFDLREMQAAQKPDHRGKKFERAVTSGQFHWSVAPTPGTPKLVGRAEVVSKTEKVNSSYSCPTCCPDSGPYGGWVDGGLLFIDGFEVRDSDGQYYDCYWYVTYAGSIAMFDQWIDSTSIATMGPGPGSDPMLQGISEGSTFLMGEWNVQYNYTDGMDCYYQNDTSWDDSPVEVADSRKIISVDQTIINESSQGGEVVECGQFQVVIRIQVGCPPPSHTVDLIGNITSDATLLSSNETTVSNQNNELCTYDVTKVYRMKNRLSQSTGTGFTSYTAELTWKSISVTRAGPGISTRATITGTGACP